MAVHEREDRVTIGIPRLAVQGLLIKACPHCGAPGCYRSLKFHPQIEQWPGCHVEVNDPADGAYVGLVCPNCGNARPQPVQQGTHGELAASMPRWQWRALLGIKWCWLKFRSIKRSLKHAT